jgi:hypothetical protein
LKVALGIILERFAQTGGKTASRAAHYAGSGELDWRRYGRSVGFEARNFCAHFPVG